MSDLISVCYRMSDVVSPVVQSSSPEGLIPMDNDSGNQCSQCNSLIAQLVLNLIMPPAAIMHF